MEKDFSYTLYNPNLKDNARNLRKSMTPQERRLWYCFLKDYPLKFYRQRVIGVYIADFYCSKAKLVIEIDGSQHYTEEGISYDEVRTFIINELGIEVIRFTNQDIDTNFEGVCLEINRIIGKQLNL